MLGWRGAARADSGDPAGTADMREGYAILSQHAHYKAATTATNLAEYLIAGGLLAEAGGMYREAREWARRLGDTRAETWSAGGLGRLAYHAGEPAAAWGLLAEAETDQLRGVALNQILSGHLLLASDPQRAIGLAASALGYANDTENNEVRLEAIALAARAALAAGDRAAADRAADDYLACWNATGTRAMSAISLLEVGFVLAALDRHAELALAAGYMATGGWADAARALAARRYDEAIAVLEQLPSAPLSAAVRTLAAENAPA